MARPKQFDREQALVKAMYTFWEKGYAATSVHDLLQSMGISRSSLYEFIAKECCQRKRRQ